MSIFDDYDVPVKDELDGLPLEERIEIRKAEILKEKAEKERKKEEKMQAAIKAKQDKTYKIYTSKIERMIKWMIGLSLFFVVAVGYMNYKDYFIHTLQGGLTIAGQTKDLGKAIVEFIFSMAMCFLAPALLTFFIVDLSEEKEEK